MTTESTPGDATTTTCWCCGETHQADEFVRLGCHDEVALCDGCVGWLGERQLRREGNRLHSSTPILATGDLSRALAHYRALGFETEEWGGGGYGFLSRDGVELHIGQQEGLDPNTNTVSCYLHVGDADALHAQWAAAKVAPVDADYGMREGRHVDSDGNVLRFGSPLADTGNHDYEGSVLLAGDDPLAVEATAAVQTGDLAALDRLLTAHPQLATARIGDDDFSRTLLHAATDWPGHYPNVAHVIDQLVRAGADVNARFHGPHAETPLHWAASSDDVDALDALLDAGADIEASGAVLGGGSPLADACGFGQWQAARRLVERGARTRLKDAAALGLLDRIEAAFAAEPIPTSDEVTQAFWSACHGGQRQAAEYLLDRGADINWIGWDDLTPLDVATQADAPALVDWLRSNGAKTANELRA
ncbi:hypothetical protein BH20ACT4_BH20ACT4_00320 [soil metagenome]